jgi:membrane protease YdiL (CAAX protease family)
MSSALEIVGVYLVRVAPAFVLAAAMLVLLRRQPRLRIVIYLALFVLLRDAMTPLRLWSFGSEGFFWIRLAPNPSFLLLFAASCLVTSVALYLGDRDNRPLVRWSRGSKPVGLLLGLTGAVVVVAPLAALYRFTPIASRGGPVPTDIVPVILLFALLGNLLEELLFRGYVYGWLAQSMATFKAGIASGVVFAFCHMFLAITVTDVGYPLLVFTLWEGIIAGLVGAKAGVAASTLTHGGAILLLSSGLI